MSEYDGGDSYADDDPYANDDPRSFNEWFPLHGDYLDELPFRLFYCKLKSNSPQAEELLFDPLKALRGNSETLLPALPVELNDDSRVTTTLVQHNRTMRFRAILFVATYDDQDQSVSLTSHKQLPGS
ncbi:MAG TPA: hypothetical protein VHU77_07555 [Candidatus Limnocylindria bacterium]|nr:hypothetical protein [Candidatus Limnocylindria bacterium]